MNRCITIVFSLWLTIGLLMEIDISTATAQCACERLLNAICSFNY